MHKNRFQRSLLSFILAAAVGISAVNPLRVMNMGGSVQASESVQEISNQTEGLLTEQDTEEDMTADNVIGSEQKEKNASPETNETADDAEKTEEEYGWVEFFTSQGGSVSASFEYAGETFDEGTFTYEMMEYGPWEAQYETTGTVTVSASANDGYVLGAIVLSDEDGNEIASYDASPVSFTPNVDKKIIAAAVFVSSNETEAEAETTSEPETEAAAEAVTEPETEAGTEAITEPATETEIKSETEVETESETETETETESGMEPEEIAAVTEELREIDGWPVEQSTEYWPKAYIWYRDTYFDIANYKYYSDEVYQECLTDLSNVDYSAGSSVTVTYKCTLQQDETYYWYAEITFSFVENIVSATVKSDECDRIMPSVITQALNEGYGGIVPELAGTEVEGREYTVLAGDDDFDIYGLATDYNDDYFKVSMYDDGGFDVNVIGDYTVVYSMSYYLYPDDAWYVINTVHVIDSITDNGITVIVDGPTMTAAADDGKAEYGIWYTTGITDFIMAVSDTYDLTLSVSATKDGEAIDPYDYVTVSDGESSMEKTAAFSVADAAGHCYVFILSNTEESDGKVLVNGGGWVALDADTAEALENADEETAGELLEAISEAVADNDGDASTLVSDEISVASAVSQNANNGIMTAASLTGTTSVGSFSASGTTGYMTGHNSDGSTETNYASVDVSGSASAINKLLSNAGYSISVDSSDLGSFGIYCISGHSYYGWPVRTNFTATVSVKVKEYSDGSKTVVLSVYKSWGSSYQTFAGSLSTSIAIATIEVRKSVVGYNMLEASTLAPDVKTTFAIYEVKKKNGEYVLDSSTLVGTLKLTEDDEWVSSGSGNFKMKGTFKVDCDADYIVVETYRIKGTVDNTSRIWGPYTDIQSGEKRIVGYENGNGALITDTNDEGLALVDGGGCVTNWVRYFRGVIVTKYEETDSAGSEKIPLEGAVFKVEYYAVADASKQDTEDFPVVAAWYFKTDEDGEITYGSKDYLSTWTDPDTGVEYTSDALFRYSLSNTSQSTYRLPEGSLKITEVEAPDKYELDSTPYTVSITGPNDKDENISIEKAELVLRDGTKATDEILENGVIVYDPPANGYLNLRKVSGNTSVTNGNTGYSLSGAQYTVYTDQRCSTVAKDAETDTNAVLTVTADGTSNTLCLETGTYYVKETKAPAGYLKDTSVRTAEITSDDTEDDPAVLSVTETPVTYSPTVLLVKENEAGTSHDLSGAVFKFEFYAGQTSAAGPVTRTWYFETDSDGLIKFHTEYLSPAKTSGTLYYDSNEILCLPIGFLKITEEAAPGGFVVSDKTVTYTITSSGCSFCSEDGSSVLENAPVITETPVFGGITLDKKDWCLDAAEGDASLAGFTFAIISLNNDTVVIKGKENVKYSYGDTVMTVTTDAGGHAETGSVIQAGKYKIVEIGQGTGYTASGTGTEQEFTISEDGETVKCTVTNVPIAGGLSIQKVDYMLGRSADHGDADLSGAEFTIVNASANAVLNAAGDTIQSSGLSGTSVTYADVQAAIEDGYTMQVITTSADGSASTGTTGLPYGTYYVIETKAAAGYLLNDTWVGRIEARENGAVYAAQTIQDPDSGVETTAQQICRSGMNLTKEDLEMQDSFEQGTAYFEGAEFTIINASDSLVKNSAGLEIPSAEAKISDTPTYAELRAIAEEGSYTVQVITTDEYGYAETGINDLPYGTYYVIETKSSYGYWIDENFIGKVVIREDSQNLSLNSYSASGKSYFIDLNDTASSLASAVVQQVRRKDLLFLKTDIDGNCKSYIPFLITAIAIDDQGNETELESHVIVSDANGLVDTSRTHSANTNGFDRYVADGKVTAEGETFLKEASTWGIWFQGNGTMNTADMTATDSYGALYTCYYRITELQCEDNSGLSENLLHSDLMYLYNDTADLAGLLSENSNAQMYIYHPLVDTEIVLTSKASDVESETQTVAARSSVEVSDYVTYTHVSADHTYRMETQFVDITDGNKVLTVIGTKDEDAAVSDDGLWAVKEFRPEKKSGTNNTFGDITMTALLDTEELNGHTIVAVDYLYQYVDIDSTTGYWVLVAKHEDLTDEGQMLYVPDIHTNARDGQTESRAGTKSKDGSILDTVTYTNLARSEMYVITMQVFNADTGEAVEGGKTVTSGRIYSRNSTPVSGMVKMPEFAIDTSAFDGDVTLVVAEKLYRADEEGNPIGEPLLVHDSLVDEDQTIHYPDVHTNARDSETGDEVGTSSEAATVYDEVTITNVVFDDNDLEGQYSYTITGKLVYQQDFTDADGVSHKAGEKVETLDGTFDTVTFISDAAGNATFTYADGTEAAGKVTIVSHGQNVSRTIGGDEADNSYVTDSTAAVAAVTVELIYIVDSSKLEGGTTVVFEDLYHKDALAASHADLTDQAQSVHYPDVKTAAADNLTMDEVGRAMANTAITDTVILTNLVPGRTYTVSGKLTDQDSGADIIVNGAAVQQTAEITVGSDGTITAANGEKTTVTVYDKEYNSVSGTVDLTFTFDADTFEGETSVVFEDLYYNGVRAASHSDLSDEGQTIHFPEIYTSAADGYTGDQVGTAAEEAVIVDTVIYKNLVPGREYTVCGILVNKDTGYELTDANQSAVIAERTFIAGETEDGICAILDEEKNSVSGTVDITFTFEGSLLEGVTVVAFENLIHNGITVTSHCDISDEKETVHCPKIRTAAIDRNVGDEVGIAGETTIADTVSLWNLVPGMSYTVSGVLMDKDTGRALTVDGETIRQEVIITVNEDGTVTAEDGGKAANVVYNEKMKSADCTVELTYTLDAGTLAGVTAVVFENLMHNDVTVASHADITDLGQSVHFPEIHTEAADCNTSDHVGTVKEKAVINDVVSYTNLVVGKEYTLSGTLMNRESGLPLLDENGDTITATAVFQAVTESGDGNNIVAAYHESNNSVDGSYLLTFTLDSSLLAGKTAVVFEKLYHNDLEVTAHADITDAEQSVYYPDIHTTASDSATGSHVGSIWGILMNFARKITGQDTADDAKEVITDTVALYNLVPGMTYVVSGKLYNGTESKKTGVDTPLVIDGGEITQAVTVTVSEDGKTMTSSDGAKSAVTAFHEEQNSVDGTVDLTYTLDSSKIQGIKVVVFEKLYQKNSYTSDMSPDEVEDEDIVKEHSDIEDEDQSVSEISIHTNATDTSTGDHVGSVPDDTAAASIHDEVNLAGLAEGMEYTIDGVLVSLGDSDLTSGRIYYLKTDGTLTDNRNEAYTEKLTFTAKNAIETQYLNFAITSDKVQGKSLTVFENIYHNGEQISSHPAGDGNGWDEEDLAGQTVYYPAGKTNAADTATEGHISMADTNRTIVDRVYFENLLAGEEYCITGQLVYQKAFTDADGVSHAAKEAVTGQTAVRFTAAADLAAVSYADGNEAEFDSVTEKTLPDGRTVISGYVSVRFTVDASKLAGAALVALEWFDHDGTEIFTHSDLNDLPQTIRIPEIHTSASVNGIDEAEIYDADGSYTDITITDTVFYKNLWTADELTAMEEQAKYIEYNDGTYRVQDNAVCSVSENAVYILKGVLMDKSTGEVLTDSSGAAYTVYSEPFVPESSAGSHDVIFTVNAGNFSDGKGGSSLAGKSLVVFETLYFASAKEEATEENRVAEHWDMNDNAQTIQFLSSEIPETAKDSTQETAPESAVKTEDMLVPRVLAALLLMGAALLVMTIDGKRFRR